LPRLQPAQDSTHNTHVADKGEASRKKLEGAVQQCARRRMAAAVADVVAAACGSTACTARTAVAIFVASDHMGLKRQVLAELRSWPGVVAEGLSSIHGFRGDAASRGTAKGHEVAAIELAILAHADELIQAGNRAFSSYSLTAAGLNVHATRPTQYAIHHPCAEEFGGYFGDESDCMEQLHPQPWLNLRWPVEQTSFKARHVPSTSPSTQLIALCPTLAFRSRRRHSSGGASRASSTTQRARPSLSSRASLPRAPWSCAAMTSPPWP